MRRGFTLVEIMIVVAIIALLAAIAIPNLLRARVTANESTAQSTLRTISTAIETYAAANNGNYPTAISNLTNASPPYLNQDYTSGSFQGYNFTASTMAANGTYCIKAEPAVTGQGRSFDIRTGGRLSEGNCT